MSVKFASTLTFLVLSFSHNLAAQTAHSCHSASAPDERLKCYDEVSGYRPLAETDSVIEGETSVRPNSVSSQGKQWRLTAESSALDGRRDVWLSVQSENTEANSIGSPIRARLWVRCMQNSTNFFIGFDRYTTDDQNVRYRMDEGSVKKQWMQTMRGGDGIGVWSGNRAIPVIKSIFGKDQLVVGYNTYTGAVEFTFDVSGLRNRIDPLAEACSWKP